MVILTNLGKLETWCQTVLPNRLLLIWQKLLENAKIETFKWDILGDFQTICIMSNITKKRFISYVLINVTETFFLFLFFFRKILDPIFYSVCSCPWWLVPWYANSLGRLFHSLKELLNGQKSTVGSLNSLTIIFFLKLFFDFWSESDMVLGPDWGWRRMQTFGFLS